MMLTLIPARGGSKRLPGKNLMTINGKSLVEIAVHVAMEADCSPIVVSTDCPDIAHEAFMAGAHVINRPGEYAEDDTPMFDVIEHAVEAVGWFDSILLLQPTSPLRSLADVQGCYELMQKKGVPVVTVHNGKLNGAVFCSPMAAYMQDKTFITPDTTYIPMPRERSVDIDTLGDMVRAREMSSVHSLMGA